MNRSSNLEHFGTKGMKWGVHQTKGTQEFKSRFKTADARAAEIHRARASVKKTKTAYKKEKDPVKRQALKDIHLKNPDTATALRMTRGEKFVNGLLYAAVPIPVVPLAVGVGTAIRVGKRRAIQN